MRSLFILFLFLSCPAFAQKAKCHVGMGINDMCSSPYNGKEPIRLFVTNLKPNYIYNINAPVNMVGNTIATILAAWWPSNSDSTLTYIFNGSTSDWVVLYSKANAWMLPSGSYDIEIIDAYDKGKMVCKCSFNIQ